MYLRISNDCVVPKDEIIGIFDMDNTTVSRQGRNFLPEAEKNGCIIYTSDELPKSYVVTAGDGAEKVYLSSLSSRILQNRAKSKDLLV
ncbi:MAG: DUF370 domain-containing protein [Oscillospiraceae bacterium]|nr:DUF370 domain-containing protein [Oscillospiraceae bacterium]